MSFLNQLPYLILNGFTTQGFHVPGGLADKTDFYITGRDMVNWILGFVGLIAVLVIVWGGFILLTAAGNADRVKKAKGAITYALIGILIIALSYSASMFLARNLSPEVLDQPSPTPTIQFVLPIVPLPTGYQIVTPTP